MSPETLALYVATCPGCSGTFSLAEPCPVGEQENVRARFELARNCTVRCPYCGRHREMGEVTTRWLFFQPEPFRPCGEPFEPSEAQE